MVNGRNYGVVFRRGKTKCRSLGEGFNIAKAAEKSKKMNAEYKACGIDNQGIIAGIFKEQTQQW